MAARRLNFPSQFMKHAVGLLFNNGEGHSYSSDEPPYLDEGTSGAMHLISPSWFSDVFETVFLRLSVDSFHSRADVKSGKTPSPSPRHQSDVKLGSGVSLPVYPRGVRPVLSYFPAFCFLYEDPG